MSTNHTRDDWADPRVGEKLQRALDGLAGQAASASGIEGAMDSVRARVRRRRATKKAGIGVTALAVAGGLAIGGAALLPDQPLVVPPAVTPTPTETVDPTPTDPTPTETEPTEPGSALSMIQNGYQPSWLEGTDLVCGMTTDELPGRPDGYRLEVTGPIETEMVAGDDGEQLAVWRVPTRLTTPDDMPSGGVLASPTLVMSQDGRVVDVGMDTTEDPVRVDAGQSVVRDAGDGPVTTCSPDGTEGGFTTYYTHLPAGRYEVRVFYTLWTDRFTTGQLILSDPFEVVMTDDGAVRPAAGGGGPGTPSDDCSAAALDVDAPDLSVLPEPVQDTAARLLEAALACDDETLVAMSTEDNTFLSYGGTEGPEFWTLPDAEQYEDVYAKLALLITGTRWIADPPSDQGPYTWTWPRVHSQEWVESDEAWREVVDAGVVSEEYAEEMRLIHGQYLGYRLGIHEDGTWEFFVAGD